MQWADLVGYIASFLVVLTFYMDKMIALRVTALLSNVAFLAYGLSLELGPVVVLHGILLPLNCWRLRQLRRTGPPVGQTGHTAEGSPATTLIVERHPTYRNMRMCNQSEPIQLATLNPRKFSLHARPQARPRETATRDGCSISCTNKKGQ
jgi:hypothetical protein